jgi:hypothetical protein
MLWGSIRSRINETNPCLDLQGATLKISAKLARLSETYTLDFHYTDGKSKKQGDYTLESSFGKWFDEDGVLVTSALEADVKSAIERSTITKEQ